MRDSGEVDRGDIRKRARVPNGKPDQPDKTAKITEKELEELKWRGFSSEYRLLGDRDDEEKWCRQTYASRAFKA
jgi:hypothetical protein